LAEIRGKVGLGKVKRDLAMLFLTRCFDLYLGDGGKLSFLIPFTVFKTQAGAGFRDFLARKTKVHVVHDLVTLYPFEGAVNRTAAIVVEKVSEIYSERSSDEKRRAIYKEALAKAFEENVKGMKHIIWVNLSGRAIPTDKPLEEVLKETRRYEAIMIPLELRKPESPWMQVTPRVIEAVRKLLAEPQHYEAHAGVYVGLNQVYYVEVKGKTPDGRFIITNPPEPGQKKKVKQTEAAIESDLVYPLIRGEDVKRWYVEFKNRYVILPVNSQGKDISPQEMRVKYPNAYNYFFNYFNDLISRSGEPYKSKLEPYRKMPLNKAEKIAPPFYWLFNIKPSLAPYKVVWKRMGGAITGKAISFACAVIEPVNSKSVVPDGGTTILIGTRAPDEAYYIAGLLNSLIARAIIASYTYELRQETHIADVIKIPRFDSKNELHKRIAQLSKKAHELAECIYTEKRQDHCRGVNAEEELRRVEKELNLAVADLLGLSKDDLNEFKKLMAILSGEELPVEEEVEVSQEPKVVILNTLLPPNSPSYVEIDVTNPSREELAISYEFPWGKGSFRIIEGSKRVSVPPLSPGKYNGTVKYVWRGVEKAIDVVIEISEILGPKRPKKPLLGEAS
jgi:type II restriction/modification system DNA methylase subunit YeeA